MGLSSYSELQDSVLSWLARPGDPLVAPAVPDMIVLAESELRRRLRVGDAEQRASLTATTAAVALPADCRQLRLVTSDGALVSYVPPDQLPGGSGPPYHYTLHGSELRLGPAPSGSVTLEILYQVGLPPLSDGVPTNWLLTKHPDAYLYSTLVAAEAFIGHDERIPLWTQAAAAVLASIEAADRKARWPGGLQIRVEGITTTGPMSGADGTSGAWTITGPASSPAAPIVVSGSGPLPAGSAGDVNINNVTGGPITITLPSSPTLGQVLRLKDVAGNAGTRSITLVPAAGTIDGNTSYQLVYDFGALELYWMGTQWGTR
jgi:hypothetical protein